MRARTVTDRAGHTLKAYDTQGRLIYASRSNAGLEHEHGFTDAPYQVRSHRGSGPRPAPKHHSHYGFAWRAST